MIPHVTREKPANHTTAGDADQAEDGSPDDADVPSPGKIQRKRRTAYGRDLPRRLVQHNLAWHVRHNGNNEKYRNVTGRNVTI